MFAMLLHYVLLLNDGQCELSKRYTNNTIMIKFYNNYW